MPDPELETILEESQIYLDAGKLEDARKTLAEALTRWPGDTSLLDLAVKVREARAAAGVTRTPVSAAPKIEEASAPPDSGFKPLYLYGGILAAAILGIFLLCARPGDEEVLAAFDAYQRAMQSRDLRALKNSLSQAKASEIDLEAEDAEAALELAFALNPDDVSVVETSVDDDRAKLKVRGRFQEVLTEGSVVLVREASVWKVDQVSWSISFDGENYVATDVEESSERMESSAEEANTAEEAVEQAVQDAEGSEEIEGSHAFFPQETAKLSEETLFKILRTTTFPSDSYRELEKRGKKSDALDALQERLREKSEKRGRVESGVIQILSEAGRPILFDWYRETEPKREFEDIELLEWEIDCRGGSIYTSGKLHLGQGIVEGYDRKAENDTLGLSHGAEIEFTLVRENQDLSKKELVIDSRAGDNNWTDVLLGENLTPGKYTVRPFLHAQFTGADGIPKSLNFNNQGLKIEIR